MTGRVPQVDAGGRLRWSRSSGSGSEAATEEAGRESPHHSQSGCPTPHPASITGQRRFDTTKPHQL